MPYPVPYPMVVVKLAVHPYIRAYRRQRLLILVTGIFVGLYAIGQHTVNQWLEDADLGAVCCWALVGLASFAHLGLPDVINNLGTGQREVTYLVDGQGVIIYHPDASQEGRDISDHSGIAQLVEGGQGAAFHHEPDGEEVVIGYAPVPPAEWGLVVQEPWADAVAPLMRVSEWTPIILLLTTVIALLVIFSGFIIPADAMP